MIDVLTFRPIRIKMCKLLQVTVQTNPGVYERNWWWASEELLGPGDYRQPELRFIKMGPSYSFGPLLLWPRYHPRAEFHENSPGPNYRPYRGYLNYGSSTYGVVVYRNYSKSRITRWTDLKLSQRS